MAKTIWKFPLQTTDIQKIKMPDGDILTVQMQFGAPYVWVLIDPDATEIEKTIEIFGTGNPIAIQARRRYIGTYQEAQGQFVWHVFERY